MRREVALLVEQELLGGLKAHHESSDKEPREGTAEVASRVGELDLSEAQISGLHPELAMHYRGARAKEIRARAMMEEKKRAVERENKMRQEREHFEQARRERSASSARRKVSEHPAG